MGHIELSLRLQTVADKICQHTNAPRYLADIGSDHAYLPIALTQAGQVERAIAGEVVEGPFRAAQKEVNQRHLQNKIDVRLGDGLEVVNNDDNVNILAICGMGGALIRRILKEGVKRLNEPHLLALQPNLASHTLRKWLNENNYAIIDEEVLEENGHMYDIIIAKSHSMQLLTEEDLLLGPINRKKRTPLVEKHWQQDKKTKQTIIDGIKQAKNPDYVKIELLEKEINLIEKELLN